MASRSVPGMQGVDNPYSCGKAPLDPFGGSKEVQGRFFCRKPRTTDTKGMQHLECAEAYHPCLTSRRRRV